MKRDMPVGLQAILTTRYEACWPSFSFVHEWEEVFHSRLKLPFIGITHEAMVQRSKADSGFDLAILPLARQIQCYTPHRKILPVIVDCWQQDVIPFLEWYADIPFVYVASLEAYRDIKAAGFSGRLGYLPMSVSDAIRQARVPEKRIDVIQYGRTNPFLDGCMKRFCKRFPLVDYVTMEIRNDRICYSSSKYGLLGDFHERHRFLELLASARVSLVSAPGMGGEKDTGGYHPVAVRFFESAAQFCYMLGTFPDNDDFRYCGVRTVCDAVETYDQFESCLIDMLNRPFNRSDEFNQFLDHNVTSVRIAQIVNDLQQ